MTLSIYVDSQLQEAIERAASRAGVSKSAFVRRCVEQTLGLTSSEKPRKTAWELGKDLFGKFDSDRSDLSENHSQILREKFRAKHSLRQRSAGGAVQPE